MEITFMMTLEQQRDIFTKEEKIIGTKISNDLYKQLNFSIEGLSLELQHLDMMLFVIQSLATLAIIQNTDKPNEIARIFCNNINKSIENINKALSEIDH